MISDDVMYVKGFFFALFLCAIYEKVSEFSFFVCLSFFSCVRNIQLHCMQSTLQLSIVLFFDMPFLLRTHSKLNSQV